MDLRSQYPALRRAEARLLGLFGADALCISACSHTDPGGRAVNEDSIRLSVSDGQGAFVLTDGLGGHSGGAAASKLAADALAAGLTAFPAGPQALEALFCRANDALHQAQQSPGQEDMKTTAVALALEGRRALWAHIGDSRLYCFSGGKIRFVTADHSVSYRKYLHGAISSEEIAHDIDRSQLLRALGQPVCRPETGGCRVRPGDAFLLCSDGFWEHVRDREMEKDLRDAATPEVWMERLLRRRQARAGENSDNFSVIAVFLTRKTDGISGF